MKYLTNTNRVQVCKKDLCVNAEGKNADKIAGAAIFMLVCFGLAALITSSK